MSGRITNKARLMTVPTRCWIVTSRTDCFCPEKSSGELHLTERDALSEQMHLNTILKDAGRHEIVPCIIMPEETFHELCPEWADKESSATQTIKKLPWMCGECGKHEVRNLREYEGGPALLATCDHCGTEWVS